MIYLAIKDKSGHARATLTAYGFEFTEHEGPFANPCPPAAPQQPGGSPASPAGSDGIELDYPLDGAPTGSLEDRVGHWVRTRIGDDHMNPCERAMRLLEEAAELAQAEGVTLEQMLRQVGHVFSRPSGEPVQEAGGVAVCLLAWCSARGLMLVDVARREIERIEAKPIESIRGSLARKADADLVTTVGPEAGR